jgi:hypothetical protein
MFRILFLEWIVLRALVGMGGILVSRGGSRYGGIVIFLDRASHLAWAAHAVRSFRAQR